MDLLAFLLALPWVKRAQGPGIGAESTDAGGAWGWQSPPHLLSLIMGTLRALGPKGPLTGSLSASYEPFKSLINLRFYE